MAKDLIDIFKGIEKDTKITLIVESFLGQEIETKATYMGEIKQDGYMSKNYGSWSCYQDKYTPIPCYKVLVRLYRKKNLYWMQLYYDIKSVKLGWE